MMTSEEGRRRAIECCERCSLSQEALKPEGNQRMLRECWLFLKGIFFFVLYTTSTASKVKTVQYRNISIQYSIRYMVDNGEY